jgi:hypothetical protein
MVAPQPHDNCRNRQRYEDDSQRCQMSPMIELPELSEHQTREHGKSAFQTHGRGKSSTEDFKKYLER